MSAPTPAELSSMIRPMTIGDLRIQLRFRGCTPAGSREVLADRLMENMMDTGDFALKNENGEDVASAYSTAGQVSSDVSAGTLQNNYARHSGQNVGNFVTDRPSSRVLAPPGGRSSIVFGDCGSNDQDQTSKRGSFMGNTAKKSSHENIFGNSDKMGGSFADTNRIGSSDNNYARPGGQNVGNYITDRPSSRVLAPPGGASQIIFG
ncbi:MAG: hypothetical protein WDW36_009225 [Sanguina aurantia]